MGECTEIGRARIDLVRDRFGFGGVDRLGWDILKRLLEKYLFCMFCKLWVPKELKQLL